MGRADEVERIAALLDDEVERIAALLEPWKNLAPQYQAAQMLREYAQILRDTRPAVEQAINEVLEQRVAERCAPLVEALEAIRDYPYAMDFFVRDVATLALRVHREREGGVGG